MAVFLAGSIWLFWRETAQVNLKSGIGLYLVDNHAAIEILKGGIRKNPNDYLLRHYLGKAIQKKAFFGGQPVLETSILLVEARKQLNEALWLRFDSFDHLALASVYEMEGDIKSALAHYNLSFFFSQDRSELSRWRNYRAKQAETAEYHFSGGRVGVALVMAYNRLSGYRPFWEPNLAGRLISEYFLSISPAEWFKEEKPAEVEKRKNEVKNLFAGKSDTEQKAILGRLASANLMFIRNFLEGDEL